MNLKPITKLEKYYVTQSRNIASFCIQALGVLLPSVTEVISYLLLAYFHCLLIQLNLRCKAAGCTSFIILYMNF